MDEPNDEPTIARGGTESADSAVRIKADSATTEARSDKSDSAVRIKADSVTTEAGSDKSAPKHAENVADPCGRKLAIEALRRGPRGAIVLALIGVLAVLIIWYAFYLFAYLPRT